MIEIDGLTKIYGSLSAVTDLSFAVEPGEVLGLVGPNGAGKTTTLRCIVGIIPPTRGRSAFRRHLADRRIRSLQASDSFMPDEPRLFDYLTVREHLQFTARIYRVDAISSATRQALLRGARAAATSAMPSGELSRGMKQKLVIACGLLHAPTGAPFRRAADRPRPARHPAHESHHPDAARGRGPP